MATTLTRFFGVSRSSECDSGDPHYYAHAARRHACEHLISKGLLNERASGDGSALPMSGIQLEHNGAVLWVLRSPGEVPLPTTKSKQQFYRQDAALDGWDNLLLLWDDEGGALKDPMHLVRPLGGDDHRTNLQVDWLGPVSRGMASMREQDLDGPRPQYWTQRLGGDGTA